MKKLVILLMLGVYMLTAISVEPKSQRSKTHKLQELVNDFKLYTTTNSGFHSGNLYEHSLWTAITVNEWCVDNAVWVQDLNEHDRTLALLSALLHDMGKAGDLIFSYHTKSGHQATGQKYMLGDKQYKIGNDKAFDFKKLVETMKLSEADKKIISILIAAHHDFGDILQALVYIDLEGNIAEVTKQLDAFKKRLEGHAIAAKYTDPVDARLMKLAMLVAAADVAGAQPCPCNHHFSLADMTITSSPAAVHNSLGSRFDDFSYGTRGLQIRSLL